MVCGTAGYFIVTDIVSVWVDFKNASRWQAEEIFKNFFPCKPAEPEEQEAATTEEAPATGEAATPEEAAAPKPIPAPRRDSKYFVPLLQSEEIAQLAKRFAQLIPEDELSVASLQGYLLKNKTRPRECVEEVTGKSFA